MLAPKGVQLAGRDTHFERVVVEEKTLTLKPRVELAPGERLVLTVRFADDAAPQEAVFDLVPGAGEVDAQVEVVRRVIGGDALKAKVARLQAQLAATQGLCGDGGPESAVLAGWLTEDIRVRPFKLQSPPGNPHDLDVVRGVGYRNGKWAMAAIELSNAPGARLDAAGSSSEPTPLNGIGPDGLALPGGAHVSDSSRSAPGGACVGQLQVGPR